MLSEDAIDALLSEEDGAEQQESPTEESADKEKDALQLFEDACQRFAHNIELARSEVWEVLKIPVTPACLIAAAIAGLANAGLLPKEWAVTATFTDACWAIYKVHQARHRHALARIAVDCARSHARWLLSAMPERDRYFADVRLQDFPELKSALEAQEFREEAERRRAHEQEVTLSPGALNG